MSLHSKVIDRLKDALQAKKLDALLVSRNENIYYITGASLTTGLRVFSPAAAILLDSEGGLHTVLPSDEVSRVVNESPIIAKSDTFEYGLQEALENKIIGLINKLAYRRVGFEEDFLPYSTYRKLRDGISGGVELAPASAIIKESRLVKFPEEIEYIEKASEILLEGVRAAVDAIDQGVTENAVAAELEYAIRKGGAEYVSMVSLIESGPRTAYTHGHASERKIEKGDLVFVDTACTYKHYNSDITRLVSVGKPSKETYDGFNFIKKVIDTMTDICAEGVRASDIFTRIKEIYEKKGYLKYLNHMLGRGVGLDLIEDPIILPTREIMIKENMVLAFNPSLHIPEVGGWRLEDLLVIEKGKAKILTKMPRGLIIK